MILNNNGATVVTNGGSAASSFSVAVNSKTFKVLSSTLYKNKIASIVREISSNAYDAHVQAGISELALRFIYQMLILLGFLYEISVLVLLLSKSRMFTAFTLNPLRINPTRTLKAFGLGAETLLATQINLP